MIYTEMTCHAARIAYAAHDGVSDPCGLPYIMHPLHLAEQMTDEATTIVALLHDVVEDTDVTLEQLRAEGFSEDVLEAIDRMTHRDGEPYEQYLLRVRENPTARAVKMADLAHNSDETRFAGAVEPIPQERIEHWRKKYARAYEIMNGAADDNQ